jgi:hypothetical protein
MIFVVGLMFVGLLAIGLVLMLAFRSWSMDDAEKESLLRAPQTHTVTYLVPEGVDAAVLLAALSHAGIAATTDLSGGDERLLIKCEADERTQVRQVIEAAERASLAELDLRVPPVTFDDER